MDLKKQLEESKEENRTNWLMDVGALIGFTGSLDGHGVRWECNTCALQRLDSLSTVHSPSVGVMD